MTHASETFIIVSQSWVLSLCTRVLILQQSVRISTRPVDGSYLYHTKELIFYSILSPSFPFIALIYTVSLKKVLQYGTTSDGSSRLFKKLSVILKCFSNISERNFYKNDYWPKIRDKQSLIEGPFRTFFNKSV